MIDLVLGPKSRLGTEYVEGGSMYIAIRHDYRGLGLDMSGPKKGTVASRVVETTGASGQSDT